IENTDFKQALNLANKTIADTNREIDQANTRNMEIEKQLADLNTQITRQIAEGDATKKQLTSAMADITSLTQSSQALEQSITRLNEEKRLLNQQIEESSQRLRALENEYLALQSNTQAEIDALTQSGEIQQQNISSLTHDKQLLGQEIKTYNRQLLTIKGEYEVVKAKYDELVKPARSTKGKYIAEVYYIKGENGNFIRYKEPGDRGFRNLPLPEVEKQLTKLKAQWGQDLYIKIIIPQDSGLTYNEAWNFMRDLLAKYDYYYQE
ncbi:MAG: hypothetical protein GY770_00115, partial [Aestuariibacter sp.]|nr:hypothetical protein [Aestuariibacter sp.]